MEAKEVQSMPNKNRWEEKRRRNENTRKNWKDEEKAEGTSECKVGTNKKDDETSGQMWETSKKEEVTTILWWNGGGKLISRLAVNPVLKDFLDKKPDIFAYGESLVFRRKKDLKLLGYKVIVHKAQLKGLKRGIVIYYKEKLANIITKEHSSDKYDIIWLRMKSPDNESLIAFFYAPGANHDEKHREEFYDELREGIDRYKQNKIYLMGDSNA